jgi:hypothetical protein
MARRKRGSFTPESKSEAVQLSKVGDRSVSQVAKELDPTGAFQHMPASPEPSPSKLAPSCRYGSARLACAI